MREREREMADIQCNVCHRERKKNNKFYDLMRISYNHCIDTEINKFDTIATADNNYYNELT